MEKFFLVLFFFHFYFLLTSHVANKLQIGWISNYQIKYEILSIYPNSVRNVHVPSLCIGIALPIPKTDRTLLSYMEPNLYTIRSDRIKMLDFRWVRGKSRIGLNFFCLWQVKYLGWTRIHPRVRVTHSRKILESNKYLL